MAQDTYKHGFPCCWIYYAQLTESSKCMLQLRPSSDISCECPINGHLRNVILVTEKIKLCQKVIKYHNVYTTDSNIFCRMKQECAGASFLTFDVLDLSMKTTDYSADPRLKDG